MNHEIFLDQYSHAFIIAKDIAGGIEEPIELLDKDFVEYATGIFYDATDQVIHTSDAANAATILSHRAKRKNVDPKTGEIIVKPLFVRVAWEDPNKRDTIFIDLADSKRSIIVIGAGEGFKVVKQSDVPIIFRRQNRLPLPIPPKEYDLDIAEQFLDLFQVPKDAYYKRLMAKCMMGMRMIPSIPHPIELPHGGKGGIKSSWCEAQKRMIDPSTNKTPTILDNEDNFALQGYHNYVLVYDNIKRKNVPKWFPDALCRYVYQEDVEKRQHYSNMKTVSFGSSGCAIVNGINKMFEEEDVLDRCVMSEWRRLKPGQFKTKAKVEQEFQRIQPQMLACLCDKVSDALAMYNKVEKEIESQLTRMADFMVWGECLARAFGYKPEEFIRAYKSNIDLQNVEIIQNSTIGRVLVNFAHREYNLIIADRRAVGTAAAPIEYDKGVGKRAVIVFKGTIDTLYKKLQEIAQVEPFNVDIQKAKDWPKGTNKLSQWLRLILSNLSEAFGIDVEITQDTTGTLTGHKNRVYVQVTKNPDVAPAELFGSEDKDGKDGSMRMRGKGKGDSASPSGGEDGRCKKVPRGLSLQSLPSLPNGVQQAEESTLDKSKNPGNQTSFSGEISFEIAPFDETSSNHASKDSKDGKDTFDKIVATDASAQAPAQAEALFTSSPSPYANITEQQVDAPERLHLAMYRASQTVMQRSSLRIGLPLARVIRRSICPGKKMSLSLLYAREPRT